MSAAAPDAARRVAVVSSAQTSLRPGRADVQHIDLISEAVNRCLAGAGIAWPDIDFVIDSGSDVLDGRSISNCGFLGALGAHHKEESRVEEDGLWAALYGHLKISSGHSDVGLIVAYSKPSESDLDAFYWSQTEPFFQRPLGIGRATALGLQAGQYLAAGGHGEDVLAEVAAHDWAAAAGNPRLALADVPSRDDVAASAPVATPLRELMLSRPVDGAVAVLLATEEIARRSDTAPVFIDGLGCAMDEHMLAQREGGRLDACAAAAASAARMAGRADLRGIPLAEVSASSAAGELMVLEALGLADGPAVDLYRDGSPVAVNPSGGALPADPVMATGLIRLAEAAAQLSGRAGYGPAGAEAAVVHGSGGLGMQNHCVFVLGR
ncbi:3-ketoacyl-CoA thiolase [Baekduia soli]|uniref:3-ketoacyl-CoA thiolase n=1 Tax=Baekduia soli TaxID=496014 RepID=A0A5B8U0K0_9ACTN|nr:3-ketoacyl-CoA thiolase [Baekduia soli]QEC46498.1 3-ketoacyl-CoA thiolase [Baekduia soli]